MCSACGTGRTSAPWEDALIGSTRSARQRLIDVLDTVPGLRVHVNPFAPGYLIKRSDGRRTAVVGLDDLLDYLDSGEASMAGSTPAHADISGEVERALVAISRLRRGPGISRVALPSADGDVVAVIQAGHVSLTRP